MSLRTLVATATALKVLKIVEFSISPRDLEKALESGRFCNLEASMAHLPHILFC